MTPSPTQRCVECKRHPSGEHRVTDFCEYCGSALKAVVDPDVERVTIGCYRCAKRFEVVKGSGVTFCAACEVARANAPPPPKPPPPSLWSHPWPKAFIAGSVTTSGVILAFKFVSSFIPPAGNEQGQLISLVVTIGGVFAIAAVLGVLAVLVLPPEMREAPDLPQVPFTAGVIAAVAILSWVATLMR